MTPLKSGDALIITDIQNDFLPEGALAISGSANIHPRRAGHGLLRVEHGQGCPRAAVPSRPILGGLHIAEQQVAPCEDADQLLVPHNRHACEGSVLKEFGHLK